MANLIGSGLKLLCGLQTHSKLECRWTWPEAAILSADQKKRGLWVRGWGVKLFSRQFCTHAHSFQIGRGKLTSDVKESEGELFHDNSEWFKGRPCRRAIIGLFSGTNYQEHP